MNTHTINRPHAVYVNKIKMYFFLIILYFFRSFSATTAIDFRLCRIESTQYTPINIQLKLLNDFYFPGSYFDYKITL